MAIDNTYQAIATQTLGSAASSVTFSSISGAYTDLRIVFIGKGTTNSDLGIRFNSSSSANYSSTRLIGNGSSASSSRIATGSGLSYIRLTATAVLNTSNDLLTVIDILNYSNTTTYKTLLARNNNSAQAAEAHVGLWQSTAAISTIELIPDPVSIASGSVISLYGIKAA
jgi:hypothetical protein